MALHHLVLRPQVELKGIHEETNIEANGHPRVLVYSCLKLHSELQVIQHKLHPLRVQIIDFDVGPPVQSMLEEQVHVVDELAGRIHGVTVGVTELQLVPSEEACLIVLVDRGHNGGAPLLLETRPDIEGGFVEAMRNRAV